MKTGVRVIVAILAFHLAVPPLFADETKRLLCKFRQGEIEIAINYTQETANGATAMISDKEIVWSPRGKGQQLAVINRYSGVIHISEGLNEHSGMCNAISP